MCGIAGSLGAREPDPSRIDQTLRLMSNRGPDGRGRETVREAGAVCTLLHSRLAIIDLDRRSDQPFKRGGCILAFNGEIYNHVELRKELEAAGAAFSTSSDTEVLLAAYLAWGEAFLDRLEGMWAFALYDGERRRLLLSRDRFGEKPLYLLRDPSLGLIFGSEPKYLAALSGRRLAPDMQQLRRYLVNGYKSLHKGESTFFQDVAPLPPASLLSLDMAGGQATSRYWRPRFEPDESLTFERAVSETRDKLVRSVGLRLRTDVPLAFCMSGGVDSNALIATAKKALNFDVHGFTISNSDARYEEKEMVDCAVSELGLRHTSIPLDGRDFLPRLRDLVRYHDAPVYTVTYFAHWLLMKSVAAGYKVSVSGTGADELFTGYYDHHLAYLRQVRDQPELHAAAKAAWERTVKPYVRNPYLGDPELFVKDSSFRGHIFLNADKFAADLMHPWSEPFAEEAFTDDLLRNRMMNEAFHEAVPAILHEDDLNAMYYSIENRSPFLDRELFELCYRIPTRHLIRGGRAKAVLREAMRGLVPDKILDNPRKVGFNAPVFSLLDARSPEVRRQVLDPASPIFEHVRRDRIEALLDRAALPNSESKFLFYFLNAQIFLEEFSR